MTGVQTCALPISCCDHQWIHVDPEKAAAGPFGTTIGHGYLTLSLLPVMSYEVIPRQGAGMSVNYGLNKVRFPAPVPVGSRVRGTFHVDSVEESDWGFQAQMTATVCPRAISWASCDRSWISGPGPGS